MKMEDFEPVLNLFYCKVFHVFFDKKKNPQQQVIHTKETASYMLQNTDSRHVVCVSDDSVK